MLILSQRVLGRILYCGLLLAVWAVANQSVVLIAQVSPEEHARHHPNPSAGQTTPVTTKPPGGAGGMMEGMGEMMEGMGKVPAQELYPSLMRLPELSLEQRRQLEQQAGERMHTGTGLMSQSLDALRDAAQSSDYAAMHVAMARLRAGAAQLENGIAIRRALVEGRAPRNVALTWFKREMSLASPGPNDESPARFGATPFHLFSMVLLLIFAFVMVAMYFFKMRRAAALFGRIERSKGAPPPGSAPALAGSAPPPAAMSEM